MKNIFMLSILLSLGFSMPVFAEASTPLVEPSANDSPYKAQVFTGIYQQNSADSYATATALLPLVQSQEVLLFAQIGRLQDFNIASITSSNLGLRILTDEQSMLWGLYAGYDYQKTNNNNTYHHLAFGGQWRTERWHAYSNVYIPISTQKRTTISDSTTAGLSEKTDSNGYYNVDVNRTYVERQEEALRGIDANIGYTFWQAINAQLYLGAYSYRANQVPSIKGTRAQLNFDLFNAAQNGQPSYFLNRVSVESMVQYDKANKTSWYAGLKFVFDLTPQRAKSRSASLTRMQQFMQYEITRNMGTLVGSYDETFSSTGKQLNADGNHYTIAKVSDEAAFDRAINNQADVIAVQGHIENMSTKVLNDNQALTGGDHTLDNGATVALGKNGELTAKSGHDLIQVKKNNRIENIILNADLGQSAITNDLKSSVGTLSINNITANAGTQFVVTDGGADNDITITNSHFNMPDGDTQEAISASLESGDMQLNITNNTIVFGKGSSNYGILLLSFSARGVNASSTIHSTIINDNDISLGAGSSNVAIRLRSEDRAGFLAQMTIDSLKDNIIDMGAGDSNSGFYFNAVSLSTHGQMTVNNMINNTVSLGAGQSLSGLAAEIGIMIGRSTLTLNTIYGNTFNMPISPSDDNLNYDFIFQAGSQYAPSVFNDIGSAMKDDRITVNVNYNQQGLAEANNNASIYTTGDGEVTINPD